MYRQVGKPLGNLVGRPLGGEGCPGSWWADGGQVGWPPSRSVDRNKVEELNR